MAEESETFNVEGEEVNEEIVDDEQAEQPAAALDPSIPLEQRLQEAGRADQFHAQEQADGDRRGRRCQDAQGAGLRCAGLQRQARREADVFDHEGEQAEGGHGHHCGVDARDH